MAAVNLGAFWILLGFRYHPETYRVTPKDLFTIEVVWLEVACVAAIVLLAWLRREPEECQRLVRAGVITTIASCAILAKKWLGMQYACFDPILFCTALGWTVALWLRESRSFGREWNWSVRWRGSQYHIEAATLLGVVVWCAAVGLCVYYIFQQIGYWNDLALGYADCGEMARLMYNTLHNPQELFLRVNPDKPLFYDHMQPGILPFIPLWLLWPGIKMTILLQVLATVGCVIPIYWIGKEVLRDKVAALLLATTWLVFPSTSQFIYSASYGFRWGNLCLPLYFLALAFWIKGRSGTALLFAVWAILIKEEAAILFGTFGLYLVFFEKRRWMGAVIAITAFAYFLLVTSVIIPSINHQEYHPQRVFADLGATKWEILLSPWAKPQIFWGKLLAPSTFYFGALLLAPLLFVPLKKSSVLFIGSLIFLFDCLYPALKSISYWYQAALLPVVFWALVAALRTDRPVRQRATLSGAVVAGVLLSLFFGNTCWSKDTLLLPLSPGRLRLVRQMGRHIDRNGSLFATQRVAAHFITQKYLYIVDSPMPSSIDYVLLDLRDSWWEVPDACWLRGLRAIQQQVEARPDLHLVDVEDGLLFYARQGTPFGARAAVERDTLPDGAALWNLSLGYGIQVAAASVFPQPVAERSPTCPIRLTIFSTVDARTNVDIAVRCILQFGGKGTEIRSCISRFQPLGQGIWPIERWETGKFYADDFLINVPVELTNQPFAAVFDAVALSP